MANVISNEALLKLLCGSILLLVLNFLSFIKTHLRHHHLIIIITIIINVF